MKPRTKPDIAALKKLRQFIAELPRQSFDWSVLCSNPADDTLAELELHMQNIARTGKPECGTVGCIVGWAAIKFPRRMTLDDASPDTFSKAFGLDMEDTSAVVYGFKDQPGPEHDLSRRAGLRAMDKLINKLTKQGKRAT